MSENSAQKSWITRRWEHPGKRRYYQAYLQESLLGWEVFRCWGGIGQATGSKMVVPCESYQDALTKLTVVEKQRSQKQYKLVSSLKGWIMSQDDLEQKRLKKIREQAFSRLSDGQKEFFLMLERVPRISHLWDIEKKALKVELFEAELGVMSSGEVHLAKFFASLWFHNNQRYGFDLVDAISALDGPERELIREWISDPFWP
ncbi:MAG: WGR domain-containing protein [Gammaproteobacteria bacterium]|nr:WGR domain-containing protein [Gammaproteobacteria bacterium]MDH5803512.1 WGR domain-containing protein [Gammaproteobacteria bacterium]